MRRVEVFGRYFRDCFLSRFCLAAWPLLFLLAIPLAMVLGLGEGFGLPTLFWGDPGTSTAVVSGLVLVLSYLLIAFYGFLLDMTASGGPVAGSWLHERWGGGPLRAWAFYTVFLTLSLAAVALGAAALSEIMRFLMAHRETWQLLAPPLLAAFLLCLVRLTGHRSARRATAPASPAGETPAELPQTLPQPPSLYRRYRWAIGRYLIFYGALLGIYWAASAWLGADLQDLPPVVAWLGASLVVAFVGFLRRRNEGDGGLYRIGFVVILLYSLLLAAYAMIDKPLNPAVSICILMTAIATVYAVARVYMELNNVATVIAIALIMTVSGLITWDAQGPATVPVLAAGESKRSIHYRDAAPDLIRLEATTAATTVPGPGPRPLIVVCTSGGGISAAVWTVAVLSELEKLDSSFPYHVRVITGASGGMLGAAYYVATLDPPENGVGAISSPGPAGRFAHSNDGAALTAADMIGLIGADSLSGMAHRLVLHDIPAALLPLRTVSDRGKALEDAWTANTHKALAKTFGDLRAGEEALWRPSLIFSPMMVEDGRRLLMSNLDLDEVTRNSWSEPTAVARQGSQDGVELFRVYPGARASFPLATAARLSAGFPFVSPAPELAFAERRRAVDAGYFDNHGVDLACRWLHANREWLNSHASSILLLHIRTYQRREPAPTPRRNRFLEELSVPLTGLMTAREAAMNFRNDHAIQTISEAFNERGLPPIKTLAVECPLDSLPLTWILTKPEVDRIAAASRTREVQDRLAQVANWLAGGAVRAWMDDRVIRRISAAPAEGPPAPPVLRYAISEEEDSSWMLYRKGYGFAGFEVLLVEEICKELTKKLGLSEPITAQRVGPVAWRRLMELPKRQDADLVLSSISFRPDREHRHELRFSIPYHTTHQVFAWFNDQDTPPALEKFEGPVAVQFDTTSHRLLKRLAEGANKQWPQASILALPTLTEAALRLQQGTAAGILTEEPYVLLLNQRLGIAPDAKLRIRSVPLEGEWLAPFQREAQERGEYYCIGIADDCPRLLWFVNTILTEMAQDGRLQRLKDRARSEAQQVRPSAVPAPGAGGEIPTPPPGSVGTSRP